MTRITLEPASIVQSIPSLLPDGSGDTLASPYEALAALIHAINVALSLELVNEHQNDENVLQNNWKARAPDEFIFRYRNTLNSNIFLVKLVKLGSKMLIHGLIEETDETASFEITTSGHASSAFFQTKEDSEPLIHAFVSADRLTEFITKYVQVVLKPLLPDLDYELANHDEEPTVSNDQERPSRLREPQPDSSSRPRIPQPYELPQANRDQRRNPLEIGRDDLDPIPNPFGRNPHVGGIPSMNPGGGMFVGPDHPAFRGNFGQPGRGPWGGDGYLPPLGAPQGARFDPVGPFGRTGPSPGSGFAPPGRAPNRQWGGDPDNDEFLPPTFGGGHEDMYM